MSALARRTLASLAPLVLAAPILAASAPHASAKPRSATNAAAAASQTPLELAKAARQLEELGAYGAAAVKLGELRRRVAPDADLDLALAMDLARNGAVDSAAALMWTPRMDAALADSLSLIRRHTYPWEREGLWVNGKFDGWNWYVARVRVELAATLGRWSDARRAAEPAGGLPRSRA